MEAFSEAAAIAAAAPPPAPAPEAPPVPPPTMQEAVAPPPEPMQEAPPAPPPMMAPGQEAAAPAPVPVAPPVPPPMMQQAAAPPPVPAQAAPPVPPPKPVAPAPAALPAFETVKFTIPEGVSAGQKLSVTAPSGRACTVVVPEGVVAGQLMQAKVPVVGVVKAPAAPPAKRPMTDEEIAAKEEATLAKRAKKEESEAKKAEKAAKVAEAEAKKAEKAEAKAAKAAAKEAKANMPKKPKSSYIFFSEEARASIKAEQPELTMTGLAKVTGERWRGLPDEIREGYVAKSVVDRERYEAEMKAAGLPLTAPKEKKPRAPKEKKEKKAKKQPKGKKRKKASADGEDDEEESGPEDEEEEEEEELEEEIAWYVPEGYTVQEAAPAEEELGFVPPEEEDFAPGDALVRLPLPYPPHPFRCSCPVPVGAYTPTLPSGGQVERRLLYYWEGVGWCQGVIEERNKDARFKLGADHVNFWVRNAAPTATTTTATRRTPHAPIHTTPHHATVRLLVAVPRRDTPAALAARRCTTRWTRTCRATCSRRRTTPSARTRRPTRGCCSAPSRATRPSRPSAS